MAHKLTLMGFTVRRRLGRAAWPGAPGAGGLRALGHCALDGAFAVQAVIGLVVCHAVLFIEQVGRLVWQPVVQLRKSQFDFSVFTV